MKSLISTVFVALVFAAGVVTGVTWEMSEQQWDKDLPRRTPPLMTPRGASILTCPVTKATIQEYYRICRARKRMEEVKPA